MTESSTKTALSWAEVATTTVFGVLAITLLAVGRRDYPNLHTILDTCVFLLSGVLAWLFWDVGSRTARAFPKGIGISFAVTSIAEFVHVMATVDWAGPLAFITVAANAIRPATWPPSVHILPIGIVCSCLLLRRGSQRIRGLLVGLLILDAGLFIIFHWLPRYGVPGLLGITRSTLVLVPLLWALAGLAIWRVRAADRMSPALALLALLLFAGQVSMLYSQAPHDTPAMIAHLGKVSGYLALLLSMMNAASFDMFERIRAEQELAQLNNELEARVRDRTVRLDIINKSLESEITVRRQTEQALRNSEAGFKTLTESLPHLVWTCRPDGWCDYLSLQWAEYTGLPTEEQLGYGWVQQLHPDDRARAQSEWQKATVRGDHFDIEFRIRRVDGNYRWFRTRALPLRDGEGRIMKWFGSNTDFEDYKLSLRKIQDQLERLALLDGITRAIGERQDPQSIFQVVVRSLEDHLPVDFCCICLHEAAQETLIVTSVGIKSQALALELAMPEQSRIHIDQNGLSRCVQGELVYEPDISQASFPFPQRLAQCGLRSLAMAPLLTETKVFGVLIAARRVPGGFDSADCEFLRQLSEHVALAAHQAQLHGALQQAYEDLRQTQEAAMQQERLRALGQMASGVAHDINNALSPVALYTEYLLDKERNLSESGRNQLQIIQRSIEDVSQTIGRMREFYREHKPQMALEVVQVNNLIGQVIDLTRARWSDIPLQRGMVIELPTELAPGPVAIMGVESEIREALINLVFNAVDAMPGGGTLTLRTRQCASGSSSDNPSLNRVEIEVSDTGTGMSEEARRRCLEPFFTTKGERGTGLGLAMVFGAVQRHSGDIEIESTPGMGTTVRLSFPVAGIGRLNSLEAGEAPAVFARLQILVVDDDPLLLRSLRDALEGDGHFISTANGGQEGIDVFRAALAEDKRFAVVITDLGMPYVDGRRVASAIKDASPETPVILLTGWGQRLLAKGDVPAGVDRVLSKPPRMRELREALAYCCNPQTL